MYMRFYLVLDALHNDAGILAAEPAEKCRYSHAAAAVCGCVGGCGGRARVGLKTQMGGTKTNMFTN